MSSPPPPLSLVQLIIKTKIGLVPETRTETSGSGFSFSSSILPVKSSTTYFLTITCGLGGSIVYLIISSSSGVVNTLPLISSVFMSSPVSISTYLTINFDSTGSGVTYTSRILCFIFGSNATFAIMHESTPKISLLSARFTSK